MPTGPGKPIVIASYFQPTASFFTLSTRRAGVKFFPLYPLRGRVLPLARILHLVPPTSTTRIELGAVGSAWAAAGSRDAIRFGFARITWEGWWSTFDS